MASYGYYSRGCGVWLPRRACALPWAAVRCATDTQGAQLRRRARAARGSRRRQRGWRLVTLLPMPCGCTRLGRWKEVVVVAAVALGDVVWVMLRGGGS